MVIEHPAAWGFFLAIVLALLALDLFVLHRNPHKISLREAAVGAFIPMVLALLFTGVIYWAYSTHFLNLGILPEGLSANAEKYFPDNGPEAAIFFFTGYVVELSLSADNIFLFVVLLSFFKVEAKLQHRVLFWGILGALVMRGVMIVLGSALCVRFHWVIYIFGAFLIFTGAKILFSGDKKSDPGRNWIVRIAQKIIPIRPGFDGKKFFTTVNGSLMGTSLLLVLICVEITDVFFAMDSIPAIFGITRDPFIVFTSNVFAILGLRSMYFLLAGVMDRFHYLKFGLAGVLGFVGFKMVFPGLGHLYGHLAGGEHHWVVDKYLSLGVIVVTLAVSVGISLLFPRSSTPSSTPSVRESGMVKSLSR